MSKMQERINAVLGEWERQEIAYSKVHIKPCAAIYRQCREDIRAAIGGEESDVVLTAAEEKVTAALDQLTANVIDFLRCPTTGNYLRVDFTRLQLAMLAIVRPAKEDGE